MQTFPPRGRMDLFAKFYKETGIQLTSVQRDLVGRLLESMDGTGILTGRDINLMASTGMGKTVIYTFLLWNAREMGTRVKAIIFCEPIRCQEIDQFLLKLGFKVMRVDENGRGSTQSRMTSLRNLCVKYFEQAEVLVVAFTMMTAQSSCAWCKCKNDKPQDWNTNATPSKARAMLNELETFLTPVQYQELRMLPLLQTNVPVISARLAATLVCFLDSHQLNSGAIGNMYLTLVETCTGSAQITGNPMVVGFAGPEEPLNFVICDEEPNESQMRKIQQVALKTLLDHRWVRSVPEAVVVLMVTATLRRNSDPHWHLIQEQVNGELSGNSERGLGRDFHPHFSGCANSIREAAGRHLSILLHNYVGAHNNDFERNWLFARAGGPEDSPESIVLEIEEWMKWCLVQDSEASQNGKTLKWHRFLAGSGRQGMISPEIFKSIFEEVRDLVIGMSQATPSIHEWTSLRQDLLLNPPGLKDRLEKYGSPYDLAMGRRQGLCLEANANCTLRVAKEHFTPSWIREIHNEMTKNSVVVVAGSMPIAYNTRWIQEYSRQNAGVQHAAQPLAADRGLLSSQPEDRYILDQALARYPLASMTSGRIQVVQYLLASPVKGPLNDILCTHHLAHYLVMKILGSPSDFKVVHVRGALNNLGTVLSKAIAPGQAKIVVLPVAAAKGINTLNIGNVRLLMSPLLTPADLVQFAGRTNRVGPLKGILDGTRHVTMLRTLGTGDNRQIVDAIKRGSGHVGHESAICSALERYFPQEAMQQRWRKSEMAAERELANGQRVVQIGGRVVCEPSEIPTMGATPNRTRDQAFDELYLFVTRYARGIRTVTLPTATDAAVETARRLVEDDETARRLVEDDETARPLVGNVEWDRKRVYCSSGATPDSNVLGALAKRARHNSRTLVVQNL